MYDYSIPSSSRFPVNLLKLVAKQKKKWCRTDGNFTGNEIILGLEWFYQSKMADKREENLLYKMQKLEVRECVVCFFLCWSIWNFWWERESEREGRGKVELEDRMSQGLEVFVILSICIWMWNQELCWQKVVLSRRVLFQELER